MKPPRPKQSVADDLLADLEEFIQRHFYQGDYVGFQKERKDLLAWVFLWPANFMRKKGFTVPGDRYKQIFTSTILEALRHTRTVKVKYRPAWLKMVIQSHYQHHWEDYYQESKSARALADAALVGFSRIATVPLQPAPDPVADLARAASLLNRSNSARRARLKTIGQPEKEQQLNLV
jgi:hypothetical protein